MMNQQKVKSNSSSQRSSNTAVGHCLSRPLNKDVLKTVINKNSFPGFLVVSLGFILGLDFTVLDNLLGRTQFTSSLSCYRYIKENYLGKPKKQFFQFLESESTTNTKENIARCLDDAGNVEHDFIISTLSWCTPLLQKARYIEETETADVDAAILLMVNAWQSQQGTSATYEEFLAALEVTTRHGNEQCYERIKSMLEDEIGKYLSCEIAIPDLEKLNLKHLPEDSFTDPLHMLMIKETVIKRRYKLHVSKRIQDADLNGTRWEEFLLGCLNSGGISRQTYDRILDKAKPYRDIVPYLVDRIEHPSKFLNCLESFDGTVKEPLSDYEVFVKLVKEQHLTYQELLCDLQLSAKDGSFSDLVADAALKMLCNHQAAFNKLVQCRSVGMRCNLQQYTDHTSLDQQTRDYPLPSSYPCDQALKNPVPLKETIGSGSIPLRLLLQFARQFENEILCRKLEYDAMKEKSYMLRFPLVLPICVKSLEKIKKPCYKFVIEELLLSTGCGASTCNFCSTSSSKCDQTKEVIHQMLECPLCQKNILLILYNFDSNLARQRMNNDIIRLVECDKFAEGNILILSNKVKCELDSRFEKFHKHEIVSQLPYHNAEGMREVCVFDELTFHRLFGENGIAEGSHFAVVSLQWLSINSDSLDVGDIKLCEFSYQELEASHCDSTSVKLLLQNASDKTTSMNLNNCDLNNSVLKCLQNLMLNGKLNAIVRLFFATCEIACESPMYQSLLESILDLPCLEDLAIYLSSAVHVDYLSRLLLLNANCTSLKKVTVKVTSYSRVFEDFRQCIREQTRFMLVNENSDARSLELCRVA